MDSREHRERDEEQVLIQEIAAQTLARLDVSREATDEEVRLLIEQCIREHVRKAAWPVKKRRAVKRQVFDSLRRLDILQELLEDPEITEIMVNGAEHIFVEKDGRLSEAPVHFSGKEKLSDIVQRIAGSANRRINEADPIMDASLPDGSRVNIVLPPVALDGPIITIRKFPKEALTMEALIARESITEEAAAYLRALVEAGYNIFVSGGTGAGKTTFLNVLADYIPKQERLITIEDSAELQIKGHPNLVRLECRNANQEGKHAVTIRDLIKTSLRMRPSRILVGEVRDAASIDMLQSLNTGHCGMSTGHANSPEDMVSRLETMVLLGENIPLLAVRKQIASAIDIIVHLGRLRDTSRRVLEIAEVAGCEDGEIVIRPLFCFQEEGEEEGRIRGRLRKTEYGLLHGRKLEEAGIRIYEEHPHKETTFLQESF